MIRTRRSKSRNESCTGSENTFGLTKLLFGFFNLVYNFSPEIPTLFHFAFSGAFQVQFLVIQNYDKLL